MEDVARPAELLAPGQAHLHVLALDEDDLYAEGVPEVPLSSEYMRPETRVIRGEGGGIAPHGCAREIDEVLGHGHGMLAHGTMLKPGDKAPDFAVNDHLGRPVSLANLRGKTVVLWFYPKADTPG